MARPRRYQNLLNGWEQAASATKANAADLPQLELSLAKLVALLEQARSLIMQQATLTASKQESSKLLRQVIRQGERLTDLLRTGAREHYGPNSEKLVEFGMQPFRGRKAASKAPEKPKPEEPESPSPTPTAERTE